MRIVTRRSGVAGVLVGTEVRVLAVHFRFCALMDGTECGVRKTFLE